MSISSDNLFKQMSESFFVICGPNVIESEDHVKYMIKELSRICNELGILFIFKVSIDKANRTSIASYRGPGFMTGMNILKRIKELYPQIPIITDVHESWQCEFIKEVVDIIQIPAFLCRQTDLIESAAKTNKIIHIKKGQFCSIEVMNKCVEKIINCGNNKIILCERGTMFGYYDLIVDPRNIVLMRSINNLVTVDITHSLQQPSRINSDGTVSAGGIRSLIPTIGKVAVAAGVNGIFIEVHDRPNESKCDAATQWPLKKIGVLLNQLIKIDKLVKELDNIDI